MRHHRERMQLRQYGDSTEYGLGDRAKQGNRSKPTCDRICDRRTPDGDEGGNRNRRQGKCEGAIAEFDEFVPGLGLVNGWNVGARGALRPGGATETGTRHPDGYAGHDDACLGDQVPQGDPSKQHVLSIDRGLAGFTLA